MNFLLANMEWFNNLFVTSITFQISSHSFIYHILFNLHFSAKINENKMEAGETIHSCVYHILGVHIHDSLNI